jgi:hypothetical protein
MSFSRRRVRLRYWLAISVAACVFVFTSVIGNYREAAVAGVFALLFGLACALSASRPSTKKLALGDGGAAVLVRRFDIEFFNRGLDRTRVSESAAAATGARGAAGAQRTKGSGPIRRFIELPWISSGAVVPEPGLEASRNGVPGR